jgi:hypothetical protein
MVRARGRRFAFGPGGLTQPFALPPGAKLPIYDRATLTLPLSLPKADEALAFALGPCTNHDLAGGVCVPPA